MKHYTKPCPKTMSGKHEFYKREWVITGEKYVEGVKTLLCGYNQPACEYCGIIDDRKKK